MTKKDSFGVKKKKLRRRLGVANGVLVGFSRPTQRFEAGFVRKAQVSSLRDTSRLIPNHNRRGVRVHRHTHRERGGSPSGE